MKYKLDAIIPDLDIGYCYIYGENLKTAGKDNREIERDIVLNYNVQQQSPERFRLSTALY